MPSCSTFVRIPTYVESWPFAPKYPFFRSWPRPFAVRLCGYGVLSLLPCAIFLRSLSEKRKSDNRRRIWHVWQGVLDKACRAGRAGQGVWGKARGIGLGGHRERTGNLGRARGTGHVHLSQCVVLCTSPYSAPQPTLLALRFGRLGRHRFGRHVQRRWLHDYCGHAPRCGHAPLTGRYCAPHRLHGCGHEPRCGHPFSRTPKISSTGPSPSSTRTRLAWCRRRI